MVRLELWIYTTDNLFRSIYQYKEALVWSGKYFAFLACLVRYSNAILLTTLWIWRRRRLKSQNSKPSYFDTNCIIKKELWNANMLKRIFPLIFSNSTWSDSSYITNKLFSFTYCLCLFVRPSSFVLGSTQYLYGTWRRFYLPV